MDKVLTLVHPLGRVVLVHVGLLTHRADLPVGMVLNQDGLQLDRVVPLPVVLDDQMRLPGADSLVALDLVGTQVHLDVLQPDLVDIQVVLEGIQVDLLDLEGIQVVPVGIPLVAAQEVPVGNQVLAEMLHFLSTVDLAPALGLRWVVPLPQHPTGLAPALVPWVPGLQPLVVGAY